MQRKQQHSPKPVVVIGAGPAGLTAGYELTTRGVPVVILEKDDGVGGLARTVEYKGFRFDIGGHRFFTKVAPVDELWREMLGAEFLRRPRLSRIYYAEVLRLSAQAAERACAASGLWTSLRVLLSCLLDPAVSHPARAQLCGLGVEPIRPHGCIAIFFKTYTEKVWGIPCDRIGAAMGRAADQGALARDRRHQHARACGRCEVVARSRRSSSSSTIRGWAPA